LKNTVDVPENIVIPKAHHAIIPGSQPGIADSIRLGVGVLPAVELDNQSMPAANEVADVRTDWPLPDELGARYLPIAQPPPKLVLGVCLIGSQFTRSSGF